MYIMITRSMLTPNETRYQTRQQTLREKLRVDYVNMMSGLDKTKTSIFVDITWKHGAMQQILVSIVHQIRR